MGYTININCKKKDRTGRCHHPQIPDEKFFFFKFRPFCKLLPLNEIIDKEGNVSYDNKCKYKVEFARPTKLKG